MESVGPARLRDTIETITLLLCEEQRQTAAIQETAAEARRVLAKCDREHEESMKRQRLHSTMIEQLSGLMRALTAVTPPPVEEHARSGETVDSKPPARLGKQRYLMFAAIRALGHADLDALADASGASIRRARVTMGGDVAKGNVASVPDGYELTVAGIDLIERFEAYRKSKNIPLPTLDGTGDDEDEDGPEEDALRDASIMMQAEGES